MDAEVDFVCCDNPNATRFTIHILAAVAEHEREMISACTKAALAAAKARGKKLGNPNLQPGDAAATAAAREHSRPMRVRRKCCPSSRRGAKGGRPDAPGDRCGDGSTRHPHPLGPGALACRDRALGAAPGGPAEPQKLAA